jgi:PAS domain S-box-containing protein
MLQLLLILTLTLLVVVALVFFISRRKWKSETAFTKRLDNLASLIDDTCDAFFSTDASLRIVTWNKAAEKMYGYTQEEVRGQPVSMLVKNPPGPEETVRRLEIIQRKDFVKEEYEVVRKDGSSFYILASINAVRGKKNRVTGYVAIHKDITDRKRTEETLAAFNEELKKQVDQKTSQYKDVYEKFSLISKATHDIIWEADLQKGTTTWNDNFYEKFLYPRDMVFTSEAWEDFLHPEDKDRVLNHVNRVLFYTHDTTWVDEYRLKKADGSYLHIYDRCYILRDEEGKAYRLIGTMTDITERKHTESTIKASEENLRHVLESPLDGFYVINKDYEVMLINSMASKILEPAWGKVVTKGTNILDVVPPERKESVRKNYERVFTGERIEYEIRNSSGPAPPWVQVKYMPVTDEQGSITGAYIVIKDISERRRAEESLRESETKYRTLVEQATDGIFIAGKDGRFTMVNSSGIKMSQFTHDELLQMTIYDLADAEDLKKNPFQFEEMKTEEGARAERKMRKKDGTIIDVEVNAKFLSDERFLAFIRDITERKKAETAVIENEARFRAFFENSLDGILLNSTEGRVLAANPAACAMFGMTEKELCSRTRTQLVDTSDPNLEKLLDERKSSGSMKGELTFLRKDGSPFRVEVSSAFFRDSSGEERASMIFHDITERKIAEEKIRKSEERYRSLIEQASDFIMITDDKGNFTDVNSSLCKTFGYRREELLHMNVSSLIEAGDLQAIPIDFEKLLAGESFLRERKMLHKKGVVIEVEANVKMLPDGRILAIARDIRERKKAEQALITSEETRRLIMNAALDAIVGMDSAGVITTWTSQAEKIFRWKAEEVAGKLLADIIIPPVYRERHRKGLERYLVTGEGPALNKLLEITALKKNGEEFPIELSIIPIRQNGNEFFCAFIRDITEHKLARQQVDKERELSDQIIESLPGLFYLIDEKGNYIRWNKMKEILTGYSQDEMKHMNALDFFEGDEKELVRTHIEEGFRKGTTSIEAHIVTRDGKKILHYFTGIAIVYEGRACLMGTGIDISDRKKAEIELENSYEAIRKLTAHIQNIREEERAHIAREIHDELGQQLTVLKMDISWLNKKVRSEDDVLVSQKIKELLEMLDGTVKTVRRISSELRPSILDDLGLEAAMEWQLAEFEKRSGIRTSFNDPQEDISLPDLVKTGLFRIFQESLTNVARHAEAGILNVNLRRIQANLVMSIEDDGKGFDKHKVARKRTLGILGMKERSTMIGGTYEITSSPGHGTTVIVSVPLEKID